MDRREFLRMMSWLGAAAATVPTAEWLSAEVAAEPWNPEDTEHLLSLLAEAIVELERKFSYASAYSSWRDGVAMSRDTTGKSVNEIGFRNRGVALRIFDGEAFHEAAISDVSKDGIRNATHRLLADVERRPDRYSVERLSPLVQKWTTEMEIDPASLSLETRAQAMEEEFARIQWDEPRLRRASVSTEELRTRRIFVDRQRRLVDESTLITHGLFLFGMENGKPGFGGYRVSKRGGLELAKLTDEQIQTSRDEMVELFSAERVPAGDYDVVLAPEVTGLLAHESFGHGVEMDQFVKGRAKAQQFLGKTVASSIVDLYDDPSLPGERGSYPFDDEGVLSVPVQILRQGVFVQPLTDLASALFLGTPRTPNGRSQSYDRKVYPRMSNTFIGRGSSDPAEVKASLNDGLYLEGFRNGIEDPQGWGIQFTCSRAREYKGGKPTGRLFTPITVTGYVPEILGAVTMVGNDFDLAVGSCGKGFKEFVSITSGGPHVRTKARIS